MSQEAQDIDQILADRKRSLEEESELIVTDHPQLFEDKIENEPLIKEDDGQDDGKDRKPFKRVKPNETKSNSSVLLRLLIPTSYSGLVIGKSGSTIAAIKEISNAKVSVSEMIMASSDRILTAIGLPEEVSQAIYQVAKILVKAENQQYKTDESAFKKLTLRFLIPHEIMGAIIGKKAIKVKEIQKLSNCRISAEQGLLLDSTERKMNMIGDSESIRIAVLMISEIILEFPASVAANVPFVPKPYIDATPIIPAKSNNFVNTQISYGQTSNYNSFAIPQFHEVSPVGYPQPFYTGSQDYPQSSYMAPQLINPVYSHSSFPLPHGHLYDPALSSLSFANHNVESLSNIPSYPSQLVNVPSNFVGALIGKAGRHINEIRRVSRCDIEMLDLPPGVTTGSIEERQFKITGHPQQIVIAVGMIGARLDAERRRIAKYGT